MGLPAATDEESGVFTMVIWAGWTVIDPLPDPLPALVVLTFAVLKTTPGPFGGTLAVAVAAVVGDVTWTVKLSPAPSVVSLQVSTCGLVPAIPHDGRVVWADTPPRVGPESMVQLSPGMLGRLSVRTTLEASPVPGSVTFRVNPMGSPAVTGPAGVGVFETAMDGQVTVIVVGEAAVEAEPSLPVCTLAVFDTTPHVAGVVVDVRWTV